MFEQFISQTGNFNKLLQALKQHENVSVFGLTANEQASLFWETDLCVLVVASSVEKAKQFAQQMEDMNKHCALLTQDFSYDASNFNHADFEKNLQSLLQAKTSLDAIVVTPNVLLNKYPVPQAQELVLQVGQTYDLVELQKQLVQCGFKKQELAEQPANFAVRGDVLDVVVSNDVLGHRMSFFGNELEFIKQYDLATGLTTGQQVEELVITPKATPQLTEQQLTKLLQQMKQQEQLLESETAKQELQDLITMLQTQTGKTTNWADIARKTQTVFAFLPQDAYVVFDEPKQILDTIKEQLKTKHELFVQDLQQGYVLPAHKHFYATPEELFAFLPTLGLVSFGSLTTSNRIFNPQKVFSFRCATLLNYAFHKQALLYDVKQFFDANFTQILFAGSQEFAKNLQTLLLTQNIKSNVVTTAAKAIKGSVNLVASPRNVTLGLLEENLVVIGTNKLKKQNNLAKIAPKSQETSAVNIAELLPNVGDFVVHETHGIGLCVDITSLQVGNSKKDYVVLQYKANDKLYLPVEHLDSVSKYLGGEAKPRLNKLGGAEFFKTKQKVKSQLKETAFDLVQLYAKREQEKGIVFAKDEKYEGLFEQEFPYTETPDQAKAIEAVKADMESAKIMDRLICGDVGYGKTEVALRAIFKAVNAGYQVAFLCPTTILSQQHYNTVVSRMQSFGVTVEVLNRFKTKAEQTQIVKRVQRGEVQVLIGTHRLLSSDVVFANLGLLVLDEEQKFGVSDKEKIKTLREHIDVLTLSATPIPRSLHMALVGIRDISIIETPPPLKLPVATQVVEYRDELLKFAIEAELKRGGQVLVVYNNIGKIYGFMDKVKHLIGQEVSVRVAHGQMTEKQLENEIFELFNGSTKVLISTTLIENGIDLPTANTLFVVNADMLGLSQLYQLKGRVGRAGVQAFAYFTYDHSKFLNENAVKRLEAISEFTSLGDGYKIAMRDLEIRGAGNVLGVEQSGHMQKVGYAMYVSLLKEAVAELQGRAVERTWEVQVASTSAANLPDYYVQNQTHRLKLYGDLAKIDSLQALQTFENNTQTLYGELPKPFAHLAQIAWLKNVAKQLPVKRAVLALDKLILHFYENESMVAPLVALWLKAFTNKLELDANNPFKLVVTNLSSAKEAILLLQKMVEYKNKI